MSSVSEHNQNSKPWSVFGWGAKYADAFWVLLSIGYLLPPTLLDRFSSFTNNFSAQPVETCCAELSQEVKNKMTLGSERCCEGFNMFQTAKRVFFLQRENDREKMRGRKTGLGGHNRQKMLSVRPQDSCGWGSQLRLPLSIMQYTYVPPHGLIHFSATSDMEDLHLGFPLIFSGSWGVGLV